MTPRLEVVLDAAVPRLIQEIATWKHASRLAYCQAHAHQLARTSDVAILARVLACMAYMPGGVEFAGRHWQAPTP